MVFSRVLNCFCSLRFLKYLKILKFSFGVIFYLLHPQKSWILDPLNLHKISIFMSLKHRKQEYTEEQTFKLIKVIRTSLLFKKLFNCYKHKKLKFSLFKFAQNLLPRTLSHFTAKKKCNFTKNTNMSINFKVNEFSILPGISNISLNHHLYHSMLLDIMLHKSIYLLNSLKDKFFLQSDKKKSLRHFVCVCVLISSWHFWKKREENHFMLKSIRKLAREINFYIFIFFHFDSFQ